MKRFSVFFALILIITVAFGQDGTELERRRGFKNIKLGLSIDSIKGAKFKKDFKEKNEFDAKLFTIEHPDYQKIGEVEVKKIEAKAYKNIIYEITVIADKDPRLMKALESIYGKANYDPVNENYVWQSNDISLKFKAHGKNQLIMIYTTSQGMKMMKEDKNKKVENIADDF